MKKIMVGLWVGFLVSVVAASTNEISVLVSLNVEKDSMQIAKNSGEQRIQMQGSKFYSLIITATTTNQPLSKGNIGNPGWAYWRNCSSNKTIHISSGNGAETNFCLLPKEAGVFRFSESCSITNFQIATTNSVADFDLTLVEK